MKKVEWLIVVLLIIIGLGCLTVSATTMLETEPLESYVKTLVQLCLWMCFPVLISGIVYFLKQRNK